MSRPWMALYIADYLADTMHLSTLESGAYLHLIMHYWQHGGLPNNDAKLARIVKLSDQEWQSIRSTMAEFFDENWGHGRIDAELVEAEAKYKKRAAAGSEGGKKSAAKRKQTSSNASSNAAPTTTTTTKIDGGGHSGARENVLHETKEPPLISELSNKIADELTVIAGHDLEFVPPAWCGASYRVQMWLNHGWTRDAIVQGAKNAMQNKRDGPPSTINYFEKPIARVIQQQQQPIATVPEASNVIEHPRRQNGPRQSPQDLMLAGMASALRGVHEAAVRNGGGATERAATGDDDTPQPRAIG